MAIPKSMVEIAVEIYKEEKRELSFGELFGLLEKRMEISPADRQKKITYFYSCLSNDGRFLFDKATKKWGLITLLNPEVVKENRTNFDATDDDDGDEKDDDEIILVEDDLDDENEEKLNNKKDSLSKDEDEDF